MKNEEFGCTIQVHRTEILHSSFFIKKVLPYTFAGRGSTNHKYKYN